MGLSRLINMKNIKNFKKIHYYSGDKELTNEEAHSLGVCVDPVNGDYWTLEERAYQATYDISNDWAKENPEWSDVEEGFRRGVKEALEYVLEKYDKCDGGSDRIAELMWEFEDILKN